MFLNKTKMREYFKKDFRADLIAGIVVGLVALPLAIAFAIASGVSAQQGLYSAIIAGGIIAIFSGSNYQVSGPTGAFIVVLLGIVNKFGVDGLMMAGFMAGVILILMGVFKFGSIIKFIPYPVTVGFTSGIAMIIFFGQIKNFLGLDFGGKIPLDFIETLEMIYHGLLRGLNSYSLIIGLATLAIFFVWKKYNKKFPPAPVALAGGIVVSLFFLDKHVPIIGDIPAGLPSFHMLDFNFANMKLLLPAAFTVAILGAIESLLSAVVADGMTGTKHNSNKELIAQGLGNIVVPFFGGIPATGAIARTATNIKNGGRTRMAAIIHAVVILLIVLLFAKYAKFIPLAALAAILITVAYNMSEMDHFKKLLKAPRRDVAVLLSTFLLTVFADLTVAVGIGVVMAALLFIKRVSEIKNIVSSLEENVKVGSEGSKRLHESLVDFPQISLYEINGPMFFGAASVMQERIGYEQEGVLIIRMKHVGAIDATATHALEILIDEVHASGGKVILATVQKYVLLNLKKTGIIDLLGGDAYVAKSSTEAIEMAKKIIAEKK
ncbi:MAG: SulP family inorganic anion transporter [Candidatus Moranbacteria bacterium]|nr:SulP family inorganic anion transporter [Candidatus Moranbacteria bacterium]